MTFYKPDTIGSQGYLYTQAAAAWLQGANPWLVGPADSIFAGPPTMLLPFAPFAFLPEIVTKVAWVALDMVVAIAALRRLQLPSYWLICPPLIQAISVGHPEVLVLGLIVVRHPIGGLAMLIKPYAVFAFLAERRWVAIGVAAAAVAVTALLLPWGQFLGDLPRISANLARQTGGDSTFGQPVLMAIGAIALASLGLRRALWFAVPVLWPYAQPMYRTMTIPMLPPVLALVWAFPFPGFTLLGIVCFAVLVQAERMRKLPAWLREGLRPVAIQPATGAQPS